MLWRNASSAAAPPPLISNRARTSSDAAVSRNPQEPFDITAVGGAPGRPSPRQGDVNPDQQSVRIVLTADFSKPTVVPARAMTDRPQTRRE